jgi:protein gp37
MATTIEWTEGTWNPTTGCTQHSAWRECDNCYAETLTKRLKGIGMSQSVTEL